MDKRQIYLDNSATTRMCDESLSAYSDAARKHFGNPSSLHGIGHDAERIVSAARADILTSLYTGSGDIIFTGSGTEANNLAIIGRAHAKERFRQGAKIITSAGEHASVNAALERLAVEGFKVAKIPTLGGELDLDALRRELTRDTVLVTIMLVNNETGAVYNIPEVSRLIKDHAPDAYLHVDATQGYLKIPFSPQVLGADMVTVSAHKIEGPKGVGALYISERVKTEHGIAPIIHGGAQERGLRSGTENVPGIAAFGAAVKVGHASVKATAESLEALKARLISGIRSDETLSVIRIAEPVMHAPHIVNLALPSIKSETMLHFLSSEGIYVSSGSACSSNTGHKSEALIAFGRSEAEADSSIRVSFGRENTEADVDALLSALRRGLERLARIRK